MKKRNLITLHQKPLFMRYSSKSETAIEVDYKSNANENASATEKNWGRMEKEGIQNAFEWSNNETLIKSGAHEEGGVDADGRKDNCSSNRRTQEDSYRDFAQDPHCFDTKTQFNCCFLTKTRFKC